MTDRYEKIADLTIKIKWLKETEDSLEHVIRCKKMQDLMFHSTKIICSARVYDDDIKLATAKFVLEQTVAKREKLEAERLQYDRKEEL
jgi:hypothetical protein